MNNPILVKEALSKVSHPEILINMVSRRVRQLGGGARPLLEVHPSLTLMEVALTEISQEKLTYEVPSESPQEESVL